MPQYAVISVGEGNTYGHPTEDTLSRLRDAGATVYRTDLQGNIICYSDGNSLTFVTEKDATADVDNMGETVWGLLRMSKRLSSRMKPVKLPTLETGTAKSCIMLIALPLMT